MGQHCVASVWLESSREDRIVGRTENRGEERGEEEIRTGQHLRVSS